MISVNKETLAAFAHLAVHNPRVRVFLDEWSETEAARLPHVLNNMAVAQGRCQVLGELCKLLRDAPDLSA